jgi:Tfp pilus assembly protein PilF
MKWTCRRAVARRHGRLAAVWLLAAGLAACAGSSTRAQQDTTPARADRATAEKLYEGEPAIVHGTEFPVVSAAEGIERGDLAWRQGQLDLAIYLYVQSLAYDSSNASPFLKIGAIHEKRGNRALAAKAFEQALEREPANAGACERLGLLYLQAKRDDAAAPLLERAIALDASRWPSHNGLGIIADRRKDFAAAVAHYDGALSIEPRAMSVMNNRGYSRYLAGDFAGAEADFRLAIQMGAHAGTWTNLARAQARQGRYGDALDSFLRESDAAQAFNRLGEVAMEGGDFAAARSYFEQAISASPRHFQAAHDNLALATARLGTALPAHATRIARMDASVFGSQARDAVIAIMKRGAPVSVLKTEDTSSLIRFRDVGGAMLTGWVATASLQDSGG